MNFLTFWQAFEGFKTAEALRNTNIHHFLQTPENFKMCVADFEHRMEEVPLQSERLQRKDIFPNHSRQSLINDRDACF